MARKSNGMIKRFFDCFSCLQYKVLYKETDFDPLSDDFLKGFRKLKVPFGDWCADPFPFVYNGHKYIFAELGNKNSWKGKIGYFEIGSSNKKWTTIIDEKWHLSFPNVYEMDGKIVMMCESSENDDLYLYQCVEFPNKWSKSDTILMKGKYADSVLFFHENDVFLFAYNIGDDVARLEIYKRTADGFALVQTIEDEEKTLRPAGRVFMLDNVSFLPTQNCKKWYGAGVLIQKISILYGKFVFETCGSIGLDDYEKMYGEKIIQLHTLNNFGSLTCIDISRHLPSLYVFPSKFRSFLYEIKQKLFGKQR